MAIIDVKWDQLNIGKDVLLSNEDLSAIIPTSDNSVRANLGKTEGKWYWEIRADEVPNAYARVGIVNDLADMNSLYITEDVRWYESGGKKTSTAGTVVDYGEIYSTGDIIGVALDLDNGTLEFYKNGISQGVSHDDVLSMGVVFPAASSRTSKSLSFTVNFGATPFVYPIPEGFSPYNLELSNKILILSEDDKVIKTEKGELLDESAVPTMTSNTEPYGRVYGTFQNAWVLFSGEGYVNYRRDEWFAYEFIEPIRIEAYSFAWTADPLTEWKFEGSVDGLNWELLDKRSETSIQNEKYAFSNEKSFKHYRFTVLKVTNTSTSYSRLRNVKMYGFSQDKIKQLPSQTEQDFINHGMSPEDLTDLDLSQEYTEKHYIQNQSTQLGSSKLFRQPLDVDKIIKKVEIK